MPQLIYEAQSTQEFIVGREPGWLINSGIGIIFTMLAILFFLAWFIRYPDAIQARIVLSSTTPPAELVAKTQGRIENVFVQPDEKVLKGQALMLLESDTDQSQVAQLLSILQSQDSKESWHNLPNKKIAILDRLDKLGELNGALSLWLEALNNYNAHLQSNEFLKQQNNLVLQQEHINEIMQSLQTKRKQMSQRLTLLEQDLDNNRLMNKKGLVSNSDLVPITDRYLSQQLVMTDIDLEITKNKQKKATLSQSIIELTARYSDQKSKLLRLATISRANLISSIKQWENTYLVTAPTDGTVSFPRKWRAQQQVESGENLINLVRGLGSLEGSLIVAHQGAGKISQQQQVEIELDKFPAYEFGKIVGEVTDVAIVANEEGYLVNVAVDDTLVTTYNIPLSSSPKLLGNAKILTNEMSLAERLFSTLTAAFD